MATTVFLNFREVHDTTGRYAQVAAQLDGRGVPDIDRAVRELWVLPVLEPFRQVTDAALWRRLLEVEEVPAAAHLEDALFDEPDAATQTPESASITSQLSTRLEELEAVQVIEELEPREELQERLRVLVAAISEFCGHGNDEALEAYIVATTMSRVERVLQSVAVPEEDEDELGLHLEPQDTLQIRATLLGWALVQELGSIVSQENAADHGRAWLDEWLLADTLGHTLRAVGLEEADANESLQIIKILTANSLSFASLSPEKLFEWVSLLVSDADVKQFIGVNRFENVVWFNREGLESLLEWLVTAVAVLHSDETQAQNRAELATQLEAAAEQSGYQIVKLLENVRMLRPKAK
jgi:hypothetical protein